MKKNSKRVLSFLLVFALFAAIDLSIFFGYTVRCIPDTSKQMQAKSVELNEYLPFEENSSVYKSEGTLNLQGDYPVLDSAAALYPVVSAFAHALYDEESVSFDGEKFTEESCLQMNNTRAAYKSIVDGNTDIALLAKPSEEQLAYAKEKGVTLKLTPVGYEAFVFLVHKDNPVDELSKEQVRGIYSGKYTSWSQLGGKHKSIIPLQRNEGSGSQTSFLSFMSGEKVVARSASPFGSCIGFSFRYYVEDLVKNGNVKTIALDGVTPSVEHVRDRSYPITSNFYAVTNEANEKESVKKMLEWMRSSEGQNIIEHSGYVGL